MTPHGLYIPGIREVSRQGTYPVPLKYQPTGLTFVLLVVPIDYSMMVYYTIGL